MKLEIAKKLADLFRKKEIITSCKNELSGVKKLEVRYLNENDKVVRTMSWPQDSLEYQSILNGYERELMDIDKQIEEM